MLQSFQDYSDLIGKPYMGCWNLVRLMYFRCFNIALPDMQQAAHDVPDYWLHVARGQQRFGDVLVFREGRLKHVAFCLDMERMLHTTSQKDTVIERYNTPLWKHKLLNIYRHCATQ